MTTTIKLTDHILDNIGLAMSDSTHFTDEQTERFLNAVRALRDAATAAVRSEHELRSSAWTGGDESMVQTHCANMNHLAALLPDPKETGS